MILQVIIDISETFDIDVLLKLLFQALTWVLYSQGVAWIYLPQASSDFIE